MSDLIDKARLEVKFGDYAVASSGALSDPLLLPRVQGYRRQSGARMMALDRHAAQRKIPVGEYHISRKIDGEFNVLIWKDGVCLLLLLNDRQFFFEFGISQTDAHQEHPHPPLCP